MSILLKNFAFSAKEFRCLKSIVAAALLVALHTVLAVFVSINVTPALRISVSFSPIVQLDTCLVLLWDSCAEDLAI